MLISFIFSSCWTCLCFRNE